MSSLRGDARSDEGRTYLVLAHHRSETARKLVGAALLVAVAVAVAGAFPSPAVLGLLVMGASAGLWLLLRDLEHRVRVRIARGRITFAAEEGGAVPPRLDEPFDLKGMSAIVRSSEDGRMLTLSTAHHGTLNLADAGTGDLERLIAVLERNGVPISR